MSAFKLRYLISEY